MQESHQMISSIKTNVRVLCQHDGKETPEYWLWMLFASSHCVVWLVKNEERYWHWHNRLDPLNPPLASVSSWLTGDVTNQTYPIFINSNRSSFKEEEPVRMSLRNVTHLSLPDVWEERSLGYHFSKVAILGMNIDDLVLCIKLYILLFV